MDRIKPAIMVPLNADYSINEKELRNYVEWLITFKHITGLVTNGHTGEITGFNREERKLVTQIVADRAKGRVRVISGVCAERQLKRLNMQKMHRMLVQMEFTYAAACMAAFLV